MYHILKAKAQACNGMKYLKIFGNRKGHRRIPTGSFIGPPAHQIIVAQGSRRETHIAHHLHHTQRKKPVDALQLRPGTAACHTG